MVRYREKAVTRRATIETVAGMSLKFLNSELLISSFYSWCLVAKLLNRSEAKDDLVMIQTLLLFKC